jgi:transcription initiation factor TFIID subunit 11
LFRILFEAFTPDQQERYATFRRVRLKKENIRRLVNHTVSQSVPASIITAVSAYTKSFIGDIVDRAIDVQIEWQACEDKLPTGEPVKDDVATKERTKPDNRGPLTPDHIREALRRYKKDREGASAGFLGLSLQANGRENVAAKTGGKRLFR